MTFRLEPTIDGNLAGEPLVFVQGWPDTASLWDPAVAALGKTYRCVRLTMPGFGADPGPRWGYSTEEIVDALVEFFRRASEEAGGKKLTLVLHDWGAYWGHAAHHRCTELVSRVAGFDVAPHYRASVGATLGILAYQGWLCSAFFLGGFVGDAMTRGFARFAGAPGDPKRIRARMNYPYRNIWADLASGRVEGLVDGYWPTCPLLFVYGEKKPIALHSEAWLEHLAHTGGELHGLPYNHWVPIAPEAVAVLEAWLAKTASRASGPA